MGTRNRVGLRKAFGTEETGEIALPPKFSNVKLSRIAHAGERGGCTWCYPHGMETDNATCSKNRRSWKHSRKTQYRVKRIRTPYLATGAAAIRARSSE
jgi:hypothetical protein